LPTIHRTLEIYLARRFFNLLFEAIRGAEHQVGLNFMEAPVLLSEAGLEIRERLRPLAIEAQHEVMAPLANAERETLRELIGRVIRASSR
jgi:hypothetical protein